MIRYLLLFHFCLLAFYGLFRWRLRALPNFRLNRLFLLAIPLLCFSLPLLELPVPQSIEKEWQALSDHYWEPIQTDWHNVEVIPLRSGSEKINWTRCFLIAYGFGMLWGLGKTIQRWRFTQNYLRKRTKSTFGNIYLCEDLAFSCTFLGKIYLGADYHQLAFRERQYLLRHEAVHARLGHSWDLLYLNLFRLFAWCNPLAQKLIDSTQRVHEFQADQAAAPSPQDFPAYTHLLLTLQHMAHQLPVAAFHSHPLTQRIMMLKQNQTSIHSRWSAYLLVLPLLTILLTMSAFRISDAKVIVQGMPIFEPVVQSLSQPLSEDSHVPTLTPVPGKITSSYGMRVHPISKQKQLHHGVDYQAPMHTPVKAAGSGTIKEVKIQDTGYGNFVSIDHGNGYISRYAQLSEIKVQPGQEVQQGEIVALSGNSGQSTAPHLHFEIKFQGEYIDPATILR